MENQVLTIAVLRACLAESFAQQLKEINEKFDEIQSDLFDDETFDDSLENESEYINAQRDNETTNNSFEDSFNKHAGNTIETITSEGLDKKDIKDVPTKETVTDIVLTPTATFPDDSFEELIEYGTEIWAPNTDLNRPFKCIDFKMYILTLIMNHLEFIFAQ